MSNVNTIYNWQVNFEKNINLDRFKRLQEISYMNRYFKNIIFSPNNPFNNNYLKRINDKDK